MKKIILILSSVIYFGCCGCGKPKVIINNEMEEGIIVYDERTHDGKYETIEIVNNGVKYSHLVDGEIAKNYHIGDTIKHNITYQKN